MRTLALKSHSLIIKMLCEGQSSRATARLINAFLWKLRKDMHMVALYIDWYNFIHIYKVIHVAPNVQVGLSGTVWDMIHLVRIMDERATKPGWRGPHVSHNSN